MVATGLRTIELGVGGQCELSCSLCDCTAAASDAIERELATGAGGTLLLRGQTVGGETARRALAVAQSTGFEAIGIRTNATVVDGAAAEDLVRRGVDFARVPLFSHVARVHDRIAGRDEALVSALVGMRALADAGASLEIEIPLLPQRLQNLVEVVDLARRAMPGMRRAHFVLAGREQPAAIAPPEWSEGAPRLADAIRHCRRIGVSVALTAPDRVPLCALRDHDDLATVYRFNPRAKATVVSGASFGDVCRRCVVRAQCPGIAESYRALHGEHDLVALSKKPRRMYAQRSTPIREWTDEERSAASSTRILVLRPTVNCNQDCNFCSANETSGNVWTAPDEMLRAIARAGRRGVKRLSFGGGEPTLARDLPSYIEAARRVGIGQIELVTNGVLLDQKTRVRALADAGLTHAFVSLHAHDDQLSRFLTQKIGDFPRTLSAIHLLLEAGIETAVNHVIVERNYRYLTHYVELVHRELGGRALISFAFVSPQFKALENLHVMPKMSDAVPYLRRAMYRALELKQPVQIGSRQGIPPCLLAELRAWSDVLDLASEAATEDRHQKRRADACDSCRYSRHCTGLWKPYADRYGTDELSPIVGPPFDDREIADYRRRIFALPWGVPRSFDDVPEAFRDRDAEARADASKDERTPAQQLDALPVFRPQRSRPLRIALVGSGARARALARAALSTGTITIDAVASPHAPDGNLADFGSCPAYRTAEEALDGVRPEAVVIAAPPAIQPALLRAALERRMPALVEKPVASSVEEAKRLLVEATEADVLVMPAHQMPLTPGLDELLASGSRRVLEYAQRTSTASRDAPGAWSRNAIYQALYHVMTVLGRASGSAELEVEDASFQGTTAPERVQLTLSQSGEKTRVLLEYVSRAGELTVRFDDDMTFRRVERGSFVSNGGQERAVGSDGGDLTSMLTNFRDAVLGDAPLAVRLDDALSAMTNAHRAVDALEKAGAPFERRGAPRHAASRAVEGRVR